jgi:hypothetical protein
MSGMYCKRFTIVTCDCNYSSQYYKTILLAKAKLILANLAIARSIKYNWSGGDKGGEIL